MSIYIAGPMTGLLDHNYPAFAAAAAELRAAGHDVRSPHEIDGGSTHQTWQWYMRQALIMMLNCDEIVLLPGWEDSRGACIEHSIAEVLEMKITYPEKLDEASR